MVNLSQVQEHTSVIDSKALDHQEIDHLLEEAWELRSTESFESFIQTINEIDRLSKQNDYALGKAACSILRSVRRNNNGGIKNALANLQEVKLFLESNSNTIWQFRLYICLSVIYIDLNHLEQSLDCSLKQLRLAEELKNDRYAAAANLNLGRIYGIQKNIKEAVVYFDEAEALFSTVDDSWGVIVSVLNKIHLYRTINDFQSSEVFSRQCMQLATAAGSSRGICHSNEELGYCALHKKDYESAKKYFEESLKLAESLDIDESIIESHLALGSLPEKEDRNTQNAYLEKALERASLRDDKNLLADCYKAFANFHKRYGNFEAGFQALEQYTEIKQAWLEETNKQSLNNALVVYKTEKAQNEAEIHRLKSIELQATVEKLEALNKQIKELSIRDALTGLYNRRHLEEQLNLLYSQALRYGKAFSVCLLDIDNFKKINDHFSHQIGDAVLKSFADILQTNIRSADVIARYGGEEFIIIMPETSLENAHQLAERLRLDVANYDWSNIDPKLKVTSSFGVATREIALNSLGKEELHPEKLISLADAQLYLAKDMGRNQVCSSCTPPLN